MELRELIKTLCDLGAPSGFETAAAEKIAEILQPLCDEVRIDVMGNVIALKRCGKANAKKLLLEAHMDEIGLIVTGYEKGYLRFATLGGVDARMLPGLEVRILAQEEYYGVIDTMPPHALSAEDMEKPFAADKLLIHTGMSEEDAQARIPLGTPIVFGTVCTELGENGLSGKSFDNRACAALLIKTLEDLQGCDLDFDLYLLFATQEELGSRGAKTATFDIDPEYAIAVDVTFALTPDVKKSEALKLRGGPAIGVGPNMNPRMSNALIRLSKENDWPYQIEVIPGNSGTDGWVIQTSREGVATALVSLPIRYMHTPVEMLDLRDAQATVRLLAEYVKKAEEVL